MALTSAVRVPISQRRAGFDLVNSDRALSVAWAAFLTLLVAGPWLVPGYLFGTDWPGPRRFDFPTSPYSSAPLEAALAATSWAVGGEVTGKLLIFFALFVAAVTAYHALPTVGFVPRATAATVFLVNPFVYGRLHYGQLFLLAGYAVLPWSAYRLRRLLLEPGVSTALVAAISFWLVGMLSLHLFLVAGLLASVMVVTHAIGTTGRSTYFRRLAPSLLVALGATLVASAYWLVPLLMGRGSEGSAVGLIGAGDLAAFAAVPDQQLGLVPNLLGLYGFWAENTGRFTSMKDFAPIWPVVLAVLLGVAAVGAVWAFRQRRDRLGAWAAGLMIAAAVALVLEVGLSSSVTRGLVTWLDANFPVYRGMRDAGKWAAVLALVYSQLFAMGAAAILGRVRGFSPGARTQWVGAVTTSLLLALPLYYGNGLLFGMHGQIRPSPYPKGWYTADRVLASDGHRGRTLFLPWHEYMAYSFIQKQNKVVAPPAPTFFSAPVLVSTNPEVGGLAPPTDPEQLLVTSLTQQGAQGAWAQGLASLGVKYILVAREVDWQSYRYLDDQAGLVKVGDFGSIVLYRNSLVS